MIRAYDLIYLEPAQENLAVLFDYTVNYLRVPITSLYRGFLESPIVRKFEQGDFNVLVGKSGIELSREIFSDSFVDIKYQPEGKSEEYWLGYSLAFFQWYTNLSFRKLNQYIKIDELLSMYHPYHEMDLNKFIERITEIYNERKRYTNLQIYRKMLKYSRRALSLMSGVPERTIEQYEQKRKNINKASVETVVALARALKCPIEDLLEIEAK